MPPDDQNLHFDVHPSVVFQLGADLITDEVQALIERTGMNTKLIWIREI